MRLKINQEGWLLLLVFGFALLAARWLFKPGYFLMHDDLQMMRQLQMEKCWQDRQIPCRWVPDMGYGFGYPLFNFYPPLPYYIGEIFRWLGFAFTTTAKLTFALSLILSGITMFVLASDLWGKWGGLLAAVFYLWAPYRAVDIFVRGAMNESWAFVWFPAIAWAGKKLIETEELQYLVWLAFSWAGLLLTHNLMVMIFAPVFLLWLGYWLAVRGKWRPWRHWQLWTSLLAAGVWALGLAAFFTLPMLFEKKYTHIETMFSGYFDWRAHFVSLSQLFVSRFWGWGPSVWGPNDGMAFSTGHFHWILAGLAVLLAVFTRTAPLAERALVFGLGVGGLLYAFLTHQRSVPLWLVLTPLQFLQFPWRLLAGVVFFWSLVVGFWGKLVKKPWVVLLLSGAVVAWNWSFFRPESMGPLSDAEKFSGKAWEIQQTAGIYDYLPKSAKYAPKAPPASGWKFIDGEVVDGKFKKGTNWFWWKGEVQKPGWLQVSIFYFPGWRAWLDQKPVEVEPKGDLGLMTVFVPQGEHEVYLRFTNTPVRNWGNLLSLISWWLFFWFVLGRRIWRWIAAD